MPNQFRRPAIPYNPVTILPNSDRYALTASQKQPINSDQLDGDFNYLIFAINSTYDFAAGIGAGVIPGATSPTNIGKFPITDGANPATITWAKVTEGYLASRSVSTAILQLGCVTGEILGDGVVGNNNLAPNSVQDNNIDDNSISFDKILDENNVHFHQFLNNQDEKILNGTIISDNSLPSTAISDNSLPGSKISSNSIPANKIQNNSLTRGQLSSIIQPIIGAIIPWGAAAGIAVPSGCVEANGQSLDKVVYAALYAIYGGTFGETIGTFNTPDLRGRSIFGIDTNFGQPTGGRIVNGTIAVGGTGGEETHTLTEAEIPSHTHGYKILRTPGTYSTGGSSGAVYDAQTDATGGGQAHNNMPPYMLIRILIYAGV